MDKKRSAGVLRYFYLHSEERPVNYKILRTFETRQELTDYFEYEYEFENGDDFHSTFFIEEQQIVRSQPGRTKVIYCLAEME